MEKHLGVFGGGATGNVCASLRVVVYAKSAGIANQFPRMLNWYIWERAVAQGGPAVMSLKVRGQCMCDHNWFELVEGTHS